jgi:hypothetical protein
MALSQSIASSGGDCNSPAGQALAQAYAAASASGMGAAFAQSIASAQATSAQKVSLDGHEACAAVTSNALCWSGGNLQDLTELQASVLTTSWKSVSKCTHQCMVVLDRPNVDLKCLKLC